jgi:hypothetical protein
MAGSGRQNADAVLIAALASGATVPAAATLAHVGERTIYRRLEDAEFRRQVNDARGEILARTVGRLADATTLAVDTLCALLASDEPGAVKLGAARAILAEVVRLREHTDLAEQMRRLEESA